jgi:hypothetical protein
MDREVPVKLGAEALKIRENELAEKLLLRERLVQELKDSSKAKRGEIEVLSERIHQLAQTCVDGVDNVRQGDIRFEDQRAKADLGKIAKEIEETVNAADRDPDLLPVSVSITEGDLPSEPHKFADTGGTAGTCGKCGAEEADPVHVVAPAKKGEAPVDVRP